MMDYEKREGKKRVSTKSQIGADSTSSARCAKSKILHFLRKNPLLVKNDVNPVKTILKNRGVESPLR
ncbi:MAG TPA: hypothetical protein VFM05_13435, partial [Candidatus Saccharimonadales bacterium]|nr:hypothetical protein [Candidatus Saccharimonadales bacterium]